MKSKFCRLAVMSILSAVVPACGGSGGSAEDQSFTGGSGGSGGGETASVAAPVVTTPSSSSAISNSSPLNLSGACSAGNMVHLSGDNTQDTTCTPSGTFSFSISEALDGTYSYTLMASSGGTNSSQVSFQWNLDSGVPAQPVVSAPGVSPYTSGDDSINISATCETAATVRVEDVSAATFQNITCVGGSFSYITATKSTDADYDFLISQTDLAGNSSSVLTWRWTRTSGLPSTPTITSPTPSPHYSNLSDLTIQGGCTPGYQVYLTGDSSQNVTCSDPAATYSFMVSAPQLGGISLEGTYNFAVHQEDPFGVGSATRSLSWVYDASAPAPPSIAAPLSIASGATGSHTSAGDIILSGSCENDGTVNLGNGASDSVLCTNSSYSFTVTAACSAVLSLEVSQTDRASNSSGITTLTWTKDCSAIADPVIESPASSPHVSSSTTLNLSGTCDAGMTVELGGDASLQTTCSAAGTFSFSIDRSADASIPAIRYDLKVWQQDDPVTPSVSSNAVSFVWIRNGPNQTAVLYHFDTATGELTDTSLYADNTLIDGATVQSGGLYGDGRDFLSASSSTMSAADTDSQRSARHFMTLEMWIDFHSLPAKSSSHVIAKKEGVWSLSLARQGGSSNYNFSFQAAEELGGSCSAMVAVDSGVVAIGTNSGFKKLVVTFDLGTVNIHYNGALIATGLVGTAGTSELCDTGTGALYLGSDSGTGSFLDAVIDEFSISQQIRDPARTGPFSAD